MRFILFFFQENSFRSNEMGIIIHNEKLSPELKKKLITSCPFSAIAEEADGSLCLFRMPFMPLMHKEW